MGLLIDFFILGLKVFFLLLGHLLTDTDFHRQLAQTKAGQLLHQIGQVILAKMGRIHTLRAFYPNLTILIGHLQILKKRLETGTLTEFFLKSLAVIGLEDVASQVLLVCHQLKTGLVACLGKFIVETSLEKLILADVQNLRQTEGKFPDLADFVDQNFLNFSSRKSP